MKVAAITFYLKYGNDFRFPSLPTFLSHVLLLSLHSWGSSQNPMFFCPLNTPIIVQMWASVLILCAWNTLLIQVVAYMSPPLKVYPDHLTKVNPPISQSTVSTILFTLTSIYLKLCICLHVYFLLFFTKMKVSWDRDHVYLIYHVSLESRIVW